MENVTSPSSSIATATPVENAFTILLIICAILLNVGFGATMNPDRILPEIFKNDNRKSLQINNIERPDKRINCCKKLCISGPFVTCLCLQMLGNPFWGFICAQITTSGAAKVMGILVMSSASGLASSWLSVVTYGSVELSVVLTIVTTVLSLLFTPLYIFLFTQVLWDSQSSGLIINYGNLIAAILINVIPNAFGILLRKKVGGKCVQKVILCTKPFGLFVLILIIVSAFVIYPVQDTIGSMGGMVWFQCLLMNGGGMIMGYTISRIFGFDDVYHRTMMWEVGSQNQNVAIQVASISYFGKTRAIMLSWVVVYQLASAILVIPTAAIMRYKFPTYQKELNEKEVSNLLIVTKSENRVKDTDSSGGGDTAATTATPTDVETIATNGE
jgi:predicted Na+-dependent transporter